MRGACFTENVLYYAKISSDDEKYKPKLDKVICQASFNAGKNKNDTKSSTAYWKLENKKLHQRISSSIKSKYKSYNPNSRRCRFCLQEKLEIVKDPDEILLNKNAQQ